MHILQDEANMLLFTQILTHGYVHTIISINVLLHIVQVHTYVCRYVPTYVYSKYMVYPRTVATPQVHSRITLIYYSLAKSNAIT